MKSEFIPTAVKKELQAARQRYVVKKKKSFPWEITILAIVSIALAGIILYNSIHLGVQQP